MPVAVKNLEAGCLYVVVTVPPRLPYQDARSLVFPRSLAPDFDPGTYETDTVFGRGSEEFEWGVYYHEDAKSGGTWYRLLKDLTRAHHGPCLSPEPPSYTLSKRKLQGGWLRLDADVVAVIGVMQLPQVLASPTQTQSGAENHATTETEEMSSDHASSDTATPNDIPTSTTSIIDGGIPEYLDWLASHTAPAAKRTFIWAVTTLLRCRIHVASVLGTSDTIGGFDVKEFLREALDFSYAEVRYAIHGHLPRPIIPSHSGVRMVLGCDGNTPEVVMADANMPWKRPYQGVASGVVNNDHVDKKKWDSGLWFRGKQGGVSWKPETDQADTGSSAKTKTKVEEGWSKQTFLATDQSNEDWPPLPPAASRQK